MVNPGNRYGRNRGDRRDHKQGDKDRRAQYKVDHRPEPDAVTGSEDNEKSSAKVKDEKANNGEDTTVTSPSKAKDLKFDNNKDKRFRERPDRRMKQERSAVETSLEDGPREPKKFTGRCRLFVGNIPPETSERDFTSWFKPYGECSEVFLNAQRGFGFIRMDTRENSDVAKRAVDGLEKKGRFLRVRYAAHSAAIRVKHLHPYVSNELLTEAFSLFGEIERAVVCIDERGRSTGEGLIEFARKPGAMAALKRVNDGVFVLGSSPRPVVCELLEHKDEEDGMPEVFMNKNQDFQKERDAPPRFAAPGSFEFNFAHKWKELYAQHEEKKKMLELQFQDAVNKLELDETNARMEHQTAMMREDLLRRQEELRKMEEQHKMEMQRRMQQLQGDDPRRMMDIQMQQRGGDLRHHQEEAQRKMEEERRRDEEARNLFMQQEMAMRQMQQEERRGRPGDNAAPMQPPPAPPLTGANNQRGGPRNEVPSLMEMGQRMKQNDQGRPNNMGPGPGMGNEMRGPMSPPNMPAQPQNMMTPPQMQASLRRKGDSDYRQSRFDQPPQQFAGNPQAMGGLQMMNPMGAPQMGNPQMGNPQMGNPQMGNPQMGNPQMNPMVQQLGMPMGAGQMGGQPMGNMGNQMMGVPMPGPGQNIGNIQGGGGGNNQGNMEGQPKNQGRGKHGNSDRQEGGRGDFYDTKRPRRY